MSTEVRIKFFRIHRCGYYRRHSSHAAYGDKATILEDLLNWISEKSISETSTYEPTEEQDTNLLHTYCYSLNTTSQGDFLLTTWNESVTTDGAVASVNLTGPVGNAQISTSEVEEGFLPGYPAYFWFPHDHDVYATVQIRNRLNGRHNLEELLKGFLDKYTRFVALEPNPDDPDVDQILGYSVSGLPKDIDRSRPSFKSSEFRKSRNVDFIITNREYIRKLVRRDVLTFTYREGASLWQSIWRNVSGESRSPVLNGERQLQVEIDLTPSEDELTQMIGHWEGERDADGSSDQYQDVGFKMANDPKVHWLSKALASDLFELELTFSRPPIANPETLLSQLNRHRHKILPLLNEEDGDDEDQS